MQINILILFLNNQSKYLKYIIHIFFSAIANRPKSNPKSSSSPLSLNSSPHSLLLNPIATSPHSSTLNSSDDLTLSISHYFGAFPLASLQAHLATLYYNGRLQFQQPSLQVSANEAISSPL
jgi:hypothetical protein